MKIDEWLRGVKLEQYAGLFKDNKIDFEILHELVESDFEKLGVPLGDRKRLLRAIANIGSGVSSRPASFPTALRPRDYADRRQITVMFCDLVGSTAMSQRLDPEDLRDVIRAFQDICSGAIARYDGYVAKFMGDGVLAYFGFPHAHEEDAERAVRAGLDIVAGLGKLDTGVKETLKVRIGIATGVVVVGDLVGHGPAQEQAVIGDAPNLAARLQELADPGKVVIADSTRRLLGRKFELASLGPQTAKGFERPVPAWVVLCEARATSLFDVTRSESLTTFMGRENELAVLTDRWREACEGKGQVVSLSGEAGIGKSRILVALRDAIGASKPIRLLIQCSPHHVNDALYPIIRHISRAAGLVSGEPTARRLDKLESMIANAGLEAKEVAPYIASLLSIPFEGRYPPIQMLSGKQKERTFEALRDLFMGVTKHGPVLFLLEDAHWIDPTSLDLFERLVQHVQGVPALLVATFRPEFVPPWQGRPHASAIALNRLERPQALAIVECVVGNRTLPDEVLNQIVAKTDGVPLFVEELTKAVLESGLLREEGDDYVLAATLSPLTIPSTLQDSLMARLDRLAPVKETAQIGAAIGREFSYRLLEAVSPVRGLRLQDSLGQLMASELIYGRGAPPDATYTFRHALVQETAYASLLRNQRRSIHARIAVTLESEFPEIAATQPALLARHFSEAGMSEKAVAFWLKAGRETLARSAPIEARIQIRNGLSGLSGLPDGPERRRQELDLLLALGLALMALKGYAAPEVGEALERARVLAEQLDRPELIWPVLLGQTSFYRVRGEHRQALAVAEQMERLGEVRADVTAQLIGRWAKGRTRIFLGDFVAARALLERCHGLADPVHRRGASSADPYVMTLAYLAWTLTMLGCIDQARRRLNEALAEARRLEHVHTLADVLICASAIASVIGSPEMQVHAEEMAGLAGERGLPLHLGWAKVWRGEWAVARGRSEEGLPLIADGMAQIRGTGAVTGAPDLLMMLADAHIQKGDPDEALKYLGEAAEFIETTDERYKEAELHRLRGDAFHAANDPEAAERNYRKALTVANLQGAKLLQLRASVGLARLLIRQRRREDAREALASTYSEFAEGFEAPDLTAARALLAELR